MDGDDGFGCCLRIKSLWWWRWAQRQQDHLVVNTERMTIMNDEDEDDVDVEVDAPESQRDLNLEDVTR